jgi:hypothetical protein
MALSDFFWAVASVFQRDVLEAGKLPRFLILISFLVTFVVVRLITHAIKDHRFRRVLRNIAPGGRHIHHLVPGILLVLVTGFLAIAFETGPWSNLIAVLFGIGAALTLDEFALWLHLQDVYWAKQGRDSIDAVVVFATLAALVLLGLPFLIALGALVLGLLSLA